MQLRIKQNVVTFDCHKNKYRRIKENTLHLRLRNVQADENCSLQLPRRSIVISKPKEVLQNWSFKHSSLVFSGILSACH